MNDEWSRCPICFEDYSSTHRPTTFVCGHSTCINHTTGLDRLRYCPICRHPLREREEYHVSYNLEEASRLFQQIKNIIDWSTVHFPSEPVGSDTQNTASALINRDEVYARKLQAEFNRAARNEVPRRSAVTVENQPVPTAARPRTSEVNSSRPMKSCGHRCELISTNRCCPCSGKDRRPQQPGYQTYVDGRGSVNSAARNEYYCPSCKQR